MNNEDLIRRIEELERFVKALQSSTTIPFEVDGAFRKRFNDLVVTTSTKVATSEDQAVNESGASTYSVLKSPDLFGAVRLNGAVKYIPLYD